MSEDFLYTKEYWSGDSRDGSLINGDGYHYYRMQLPAKIIEAFELYESEDGEKIVTPMPEMNNVSWLSDLGFDDLEALDIIEEREFRRVKDLINRGDT